MRIPLLGLIIILLFAAPASAKDVPIYRLSVGDQVKLIVWGESGLSITTVVLGDGSVSFPLIGRLVVEGMTLSQVELECTETLKTYILNPLVTIVVTSPHARRVKVLGKVLNPGKYIILPGDTVLDVVAYAGGFDERCNVKRILIMNRGYIKMVNLKAYLAGEGSLEDMDVGVNDGDMIYVPEVGRPDWAKATSYISGIVQSLIVVLAN